MQRTLTGRCGRPYWIGLLSGLLFIILPPAVAETTGTQMEQQRELFVEARSALRRGDVERFRVLEAQLTDYPLHPYLMHDYLRRNLSRVPTEQIRRFLQTHKGTPLASRLRRAWLYHLAARGRWEQYLIDYRDDWRTTLRCYHATARLRTGRTEGLWEEVETLWMVGRSQPDACDPVFAAWERAGHLTRERALRRIGLAMDEREWRLVRYLSSFLGPEDRSKVQNWRELHRYPASIERRLRDEHDPLWRRVLFDYGLRRLASTVSARRADDLLQRHSELGIEDLDLKSLGREVAVHLALQRNPRAVDALTDHVDNREAREWRVRAALWNHRWNVVLETIAAMPPKQRNKAEWRYWVARATGELGYPSAAEELFREAAKCRCYYGFLAAERIGERPRIDSVPLKLPDWEVAAVASKPAMVRARELYQLRYFVEARREWRDAIARMNERELLAAAQIAAGWSWHNQVIITLGQGEAYDHLELRFPVPYRAEVTREAKNRGLEVAYVYALMRQESAFYPQARSSAGALGLMQLMPATARETARKLKMGRPGLWDILAVENNIRMGVAHLAELHERFDGNLLYMTAAYNAGSTRVLNWVPRDRIQPADIWLANMPFRETRDYVQRVIAYTHIYQWRLGLEPTPFSAWLGPVGPRDPVQQAAQHHEDEVG